MQTVQASVILEDAYRLMRWDTENLDDSEKADGRTALSLALQEVWDAWWWAELMKTDQVPLRDPYDEAATYANGDEVYFPPTQKYYVALQASTGNAPAALVDDAYETNDAFWAECETALTGDDYDTEATYDVADVVRNPDDGLYYQLLDYLVVEDVAAAMAGNYYHTSTTNDRPRYEGPAPRILYWNGSEWKNDNFPFPIYRSHDDVATPDLVTAWQLYTGTPTTNLTVSAGDGLVPPNSPSDGTGWALRSAFAPSVTINGTLRSVTLIDPRQTDNPTTYDFEQTLDSYLVYGVTQGQVWVWYRRVTPVLTGNDYSDTATYEATPTEELVFDS